MNGNNISDSRRDNPPVEIAGVTGPTQDVKKFDEPKEFERRRKLVEEARKHLLSVQKI